MALEHRKPVIGLVGGIGSGKSTIARHFASLGCGVIDADQLARQALELPATVVQLVQWWGDGVLDAHGRPDRAKIAAIVFSSPAELAKLENVTHPQVHERRQQLRRQMQDDPQVVAIIEDCPLLLEKKWDADCDAVVFVEASQQTREARVSQSRGWSPAELARREKSQIGLDIKARRADHVIENNGDEAHSLAHVRLVLSQILHRHA